MSIPEQDRDFVIWLNFFDKEKPSLTKFIKLLKEKDHYFLSHPLELDFEHELYEKVRPGGFLEKDFQEILANENPKESYYKTRLAIAISFNIEFDLIKQRIGDKNFYEVIEKVLIDGHYEQYDIAFEKLISFSIQKFSLPRSSLMDVSFLRGVNLGSRYPSEKEEKQLKNIIFKNKTKIFIGV